MRSALSLSLLLLLPALAHPQSTTSTPTLQVNTNLTIVDVTVTDKDGHPVHGLTQSDFTIKEDGKPQPIRNFDEFSATQPRGPAPPSLPPGIYTNQPTSAPTTSAYNIILLDTISTGMGGQPNPQFMINAKLQSANYLKNMPPGTRAAILVLEDGVRIVQNFTADRDILLAAINKVAYKDVAQTHVSLSFGVVGAPQPSLAEQCLVSNKQSELVLNALNQIAAFTSGINGRKNLIWFFPGAPWLTNYAQFNYVTCLQNYTTKLQQTYGMLTAAQVAVYTINPKGLDFGDALPAIAAARESRQDFADATGGKDFDNRSDLDAAIAEAIASGSDYYSISYIPPRSKYDDQFHSINVTLKTDPARPDLKLQYEKGYTASDLTKLNKSIDQGKQATSKNSPVTQTTLPPAIVQFHAEMEHGTVSSTQLLIAARINPSPTPSKPPIKGDLNPKVKPNPLIRYDVMYSIPAGQLTVANNSASVELDIVAYAEDGTKLNVIRQTASIHLKPEDVSRFQQNPFEVPLQLDLPPGKLFLRIGALDLPSGKYGTLEVPQTVAKPTTKP